MEVVVIEEHISEYPNPIYLKQGEKVSLGEMDDEFPDWIFVTTESDMQGWAPIQYIDKLPCNSKGVFLHDYDASELNTVLGEQLLVLFELNSWYRVSRSTGEKGWIPVYTVKCI
ncbi:SH3 domain-containing protein [Oceanisphaera sp. KMM 10153]|uniref:SH3 domain-containing protein n=1 Tax=Oceanisphaera submarina TaxID=3390193 RepID=UPI003976037C